MHRLPGRVEKKHLYRIAEIGMEDLVGGEHVHLRESFLFEQVVNGRTLCAYARWQFDSASGGVGATIPPTLDRVRL